MILVRCSSVSVTEWQPCALLNQSTTQKTLNSPVTDASEVAHTRSIRLLNEMNKETLVIIYLVIVLVFLCFNIVNIHLALCIFYLCPGSGP